MPDPMWLNGIAMDAGEMRRAMALATTPAGNALSGRQGVRPGGGLTVTVNAGVISVSPGAALVHGVTTTTQGAYWYALDVAWTTALTAAHATLGRKDLVYLRVRDSDVDTSGAKDATPVYLAGTASSTPAAPTPAAGTSYLPLAVITVPSSGSGQPPSVDSSVRPYTVAAGAILPVANQTERDAIPSPYPGMTVFRMDTGLTERWGGSAWRDVVERHVLEMAKVGGPFTLNSDNTAYTWVTWTAAPTRTDTVMWSAGQPSRLVMPVAGLYQVNASFSWPLGALTCRLRVRTNGGSSGADWQAPFIATSPGNGVTSTMRTQRFAANDYIEVGLYHNTGSTLTGLEPALLQASVVYVSP